MLDDNQTAPDIEAGNSDAQAQLLGKSQHPAHPPRHMDKPEGVAGRQESCPPADRTLGDQNTPNVQGEKSCCQSCRQLLKKNWKIVFTVFCLVPALAALLATHCAEFSLNLFFCFCCFSRSCAVLALSRMNPKP